MCHRWLSAEVDGGRRAQGEMCGRSGQGEGGLKTRRVEEEEGEADEHA